ncbi:hypothetical protein ACWU4D_10570 [Vibrio sp. WJH972]
MSRRCGEESRRNKRLAHMETVRTKSRQLLEKQFPNPGNQPTEHEFISGWERFNQGLMDTFGLQSDFRLAFKHGINILTKYQREHDWKYSAPTHLITNKIPIQLRTPKWIKGSWALYDALQHWYKNRNSQEQRDIQFRYQSLLLSLLTDSGQCNFDVLMAFHNILQTGEQLPLKRFGDYTYVTLTLANEKLNSNVYQNGTAITTYQCYLSIKTLGLLKRWYRLDTASWVFPKSRKELYLILTSDFPSLKSLPTTLSELCSCSAFWYEYHSNPDLSEALLEYRIGRTHSYSLPESNLIRLVAPTLYPVRSSSFRDFSTSVSVKQKRRYSISKTGQKLEQHQYIGFLKAACKPNIERIKISPEKVRVKLEKLLETYNFVPWQQYFIQWLIYKTFGCSAKTVHQYMLNQVKYWCLMNSEFNLSKVTTSIEVEEIYLNQINQHLTAKSQHYYANRLKELHAFAAPEMGLPSLSDSFFHIDSGQKHTRAGLIDEPLFKALLKHIENLGDLNLTDKLALQTICVIAYRTGLRINELSKLQIDNLEESHTGWLEIRSNKFGDNKTASGLRKVPLFPLLLKHEHQIVSNYIRDKKSHNPSLSAPLLTIGEDKFRPFDLFAVSNYVGRVLRALSGEDHLVFYHLRHSCFSRLQLMLEHRQPEQLLPSFYPYSRERTTTLCKLLFKHSQSNGYWEIASFAGHESPQVTFKHYFHLSDLLAAPSTLEKSVIISLSESQILGLCSRRQYQAIKKLKRNVRLDDTYDLLCESLNVRVLQNEISTVNTEDIELVIPTKERISLNTCYQVLDAISRGERIDLLTYKYRLSQQTIDKWLTNAEYLKSLTTGSNNIKIKTQSATSRRSNSSRHFSLSRAHALVPGKLKTIDEIKYADKFVQLLRLEYKTNSADIREMMNYALTHTFVNKSGITFNSPETLNKFVKTFHFAIPRSHWRAVKLGINSSIIKGDWQSVINGMQTTEEKRGTKHGRSGKGSIRLELISSSEKLYTKDSKINKYSSHLLIYLMYMSFIMLAKIKNKGSCLGTLTKVY